MAAVRVECPYDNCAVGFLSRTVPGADADRLDGAHRTAAGHGLLFQNAGESGGTYASWDNTAQGKALAGTHFGERSQQE